MNHVQKISQSSINSNHPFKVERKTRKSRASILKTKEKYRKEIQDFSLRRAKLKAVNRTSALLAGFAMVAMVEVQIDDGIDYPNFLLVLFSCVTTLLVVVHLSALMISTCMIPNVELYKEFEDRAIYKAPDEHFKVHIEVAWVLSTRVF